MYKTKVSTHDIIVDVTGLLTTNIFTRKIPSIDGKWVPPLLMRATKSDSTRESDQKQKNKFAGSNQNISPARLFYIKHFLNIWINVCIHKCQSYVVCMVALLTVEILCALSDLRKHKFAEKIIGFKLGNISQNAHKNIFIASQSLSTD